MTLKRVAVLTVNASKGLYKVRRLPYGAAAAQAIFQRFMETTLSGIPGTCVYMGDIVVNETTIKEHRSWLEMVLNRLKTANLRMSRMKSKFGVPEVSFPGLMVDAAGIHATRDTVLAIVEVPTPTSKQSFQAFLGRLSFYNRFLEQGATVVRDLYLLLWKDVA